MEAPMPEVDEPSQQLERRYRRLLVAYPGRYRRERGEEMLTTLLETAAPDQSWPSRRDVGDLLGARCGSAWACMRCPASRRACTSPARSASPAVRRTWPLLGAWHARAVWTVVTAAWLVAAVILIAAPRLYLRALTIAELLAVRGAVIVGTGSIYGRLLPSGPDIAIEHPGTLLAGDRVRRAPWLAAAATTDRPPMMARAGTAPVIVAAVVVTFSTARFTDG